MKQARHIHSRLAPFHLLLLSAVGLLLGGCTSLSPSQGGGGTPALQAPSITAQPADIAAFIGDTATLTVTATGSAPLTYDWRRNGSTLGAVSTSIYTTPSLTSTDDATVYTVVVSNAAGLVTSSGAKLSVAPKPVQVATAPQNVSVVEGKDAALSVSVTGSAPITYQWLLNRALIPGATQSSYTFASAKLADSGKTFSVRVSNAAGAITTPSATLTVTPTLLSDVMQPSGLTRFVGETATFTVAVQGSDLPINGAVIVPPSQGQHYADAVGKEPSLFVQYDGLATIAQGPSTCGAGCTYIGATGMELLSPYFNNIFAEAAQGQVDQVLAYEFGRSFWLFDPQLEYKGSDSSCIVTGYAVLMRYEAIEELGVPCVSTTVAGYSQAYAETKALVDGYQADISLDWNNTILNTAYRVPGNKYGCSDLFASLVMRMAQSYGDQDFIKALWKESLKRPAATTTQDAVDNFILAASVAANHNLNSLFHDTWRWPVSVSASNEATSHFRSP